MKQLSEKLKRLKHRLKEWNKESFGNIFEHLSQAEAAVRQAERTYDNYPTDHNLMAMNQCTAKLQQALTIEEDFWRQKSACKWVLEGERNTRYFHSLVRKKRARTTLSSITHDDRILTDVQQIRDSGVQFFQTLLTVERDREEVIQQVVFKLINVEQGLVLVKQTNIDEVTRVVFDMTAESTLGPGGFNGFFFQQCWKIIKHDVIEAVQDFLNGTLLPISFTATTIILIRKVNNPTQWSNFRPKSLCNTANKILTKLINDRLKLFLPNMVVSNQSGFVPKRLIGDNILLTQEIMHCIAASKKGWNVALKLDMAKAYDRVNRDFLEDILRQLGFPEKLILLIRNCTDNCWFSILINGALSGFFKSTRGLRQGDPLSPTLFVLASEFLSRGLNHLFKSNKGLAFKGSEGISHLAYADDVLIFTNSNEGGLKMIMEFLHGFEKESG
ncbi:UNVERIFIED_CONTAM: putative mitochondrial protein [Sesamum radiatum]|uniref:Mitochondrial protein n=1 Tax=Sesamum radiatum TaxID=300843 RepID=A0AAW2U896_SESRA